jgi:hypothetical protein
MTRLFTAFRSVYNTFQQQLLSSRTRRYRMIHRHSHIRIIGRSANSFMSTKFTRMPLSVNEDAVATPWSISVGTSGPCIPPLVSQIDPCTPLLPTPLPGHRRGLGTVRSKQDAKLGWVTGPVARRANLHAMLAMCLAVLSGSMNAS